MDPAKEDLEASAEASLARPVSIETDADRCATPALPSSEEKAEEPVKDPNLVRESTLSRAPNSVMVH